MSEAVVNIAIRLYESRRALRRLFSGTTYETSMREWMQLIDRASEGVGPLKAGMKMIETMQQRADNGIACMWICAAIVELIEPDGMTPRLKPFPPPFECVEQCGPGGYVE